MNASRPRKDCNNTSAGEIIWRGDELLMIDRYAYPQAYALPAGHSDGEPLEETALRETSEEVGIVVVEHKLVFDQTVDNPCRRPGGSYHYWQVYEATKWTGKARAGDDAKAFFWADKERLWRLAQRTRYFARKYKLNYWDVGPLVRAIFGDPANPQTDPEWVEEKGLEPVWYLILASLNRGLV